MRKKVKLTFVFLLSFIMICLKGFSAEKIFETDLFGIEKYFDSKNGYMYKVYSKDESFEQYNLKYVDTEISKNWIYGGDFTYKYIISKLDGKIIQPIFKSFSKVNDEIWIVGVAKTDADIEVPYKYGVLKGTQFMVNPIYEEILYDKGKYRVKQNKKYGYIFEDGSVLFEAKYDKIATFSEERAAFVDENNKVGYIDINGEIIIQAIYEKGKGFSEGLAAVNKIRDKQKLNEKSNWWGYINKEGEKVIETDYDEVGSFSEGLAWVKKGDKYGYIDVNGKTIIQPIYKVYKDCEYKSKFINNCALIYFSEEEKYGYIDKNGKIIVNPIYDEVGNFSEDFAWIKINGKYGYINIDKECVIEPIYDLVKEFKDGKAIICKDGKYGFINNSGEIVIEPQYQEVSEFCNGISRIKQNGKYGYISEDGEIILPPKIEFKAPLFSSGGLGWLVKEQIYYGDWSSYLLLNMKFQPEIISFK